MDEFSSREEAIQYLRGLRKEPLRAFLIFLETADVKARAVKVPDKGRHRSLLDLGSQAALEEVAEEIRDMLLVARS